MNPSTIRKSRCIANRVGFVVGLLMIGCLPLRWPPTPPEPEYMDMTDRFDLLDVAETDDPMGIFVLDGKPFCFAGTNNYYLIYKSKRMVDDVFDRMVDLNLTVMRTWGHLDRGSLDNTVPAVDHQPPYDGTKEGVYFQYFDPQTGTPRYNEDENGLPRLDYVIHSARQRGIRLIVTLTNNWRDFGGMDQYLTWFGLSNHAAFYTDERVTEAYRNWVRHVVTRVNTIDGIPYSEDPTIFAWELANEPRCRNGSEFDSPDGWDETTLVTWAAEMSAYIKSLAPRQMVAVGDEGFLNDRGSHWPYQATDGVDHEALCAIDTIDFCTFHLYPDDWGTGYRFGYDWIERHLEVARKLGKPTVLEEYGTEVRRSPGNPGDIIWGWERRQTAYTNWLNLFRRRGGNGALFWILVGVDDEHGLYPDYDHYSVYQGMPSSDLLHEHTRRFQTDAPACRLWERPLPDVEPSPFVSVARLPDRTSSLSTIDSAISSEERQ